MTGKGDHREGHDCGLDAAAYALGALDPAEAEAYRRHLEGCVVCREEVDAFRRVGEGLALSAAQYPVSRRLRRRVLWTVRAEARAANGSRFAATPLSLRPRPVLGLLTALLVTAAAVVGVSELSGGGSSASRVVAARVIGSPGAAQLRVSNGRGELIVHRMPLPPPGRIYEVWLRRTRGPVVPAHVLFSVSAAGSADVGVPGDLRQVSQLMVTREPASGSVAPTQPAVIVAALS